MPVTLRPAQARGHADHGWLQSWHSFSFADYFDSAHMGFRTLRVINDDTVMPAAGFDTHPHRDMEILTYVFEGALEHKDSTGTHAVIARGEVQRMTAGTGIRHSEFNASHDETVKLLQIWILPEERGLEPGYEQTLFTDESKRGQLRLLASRDGRDGSLTIHQDVAVYASLLAAGETVSTPLANGRGAWVQMIHGEVTVNGQRLAPGDGAAIEDEAAVTIAAAADAEFLLFDLG